PLPRFPGGFLLSFAGEIAEAWRWGGETVGVTSGASVPEILVEEVLEWLAARGSGDVRGRAAAGVRPRASYDRGPAGPRAPRPPAQPHGSVSRGR
ncbi:hypothetical protein PV439_22120, partial [Streptomyces scabiei]|nr:hypothetical protein [Streptomyces scabiei]